MSNKVLGNLKRGLIFVISAPAGTGKTTLTNKLVEEFPCIKASISCTTRAPRKGEVQNIHYNFISEEEFKRKIANHEFVEYAKVFDHYYGTCKIQLEEIISSGSHAILVIDTQGALNITEKLPVITIFISPPSYEELKKRLKGRSTEDELSTEKRLSWARHEIVKASSYNYHIINNDLSVAYVVLKSIFIAEEHKSVHIHAPFQL